MNEHILLVDDEACFRFGVTLALKKRGYKVSEADDGKDALNLILAAEANPPSFSLILLDMELPALSGVEIMRQLREKKISVPIIVISGCLHAELYNELLSLGCLEIFFKPVSELILINKINVFLRGVQNSGWG